MKLEKHLDELASADAAAFHTLAERLRARPEREPSPDLADRIMAAVDAERARGRRRFRAPSPWWWGVAAAAALALSLSLISVYQRHTRASVKPADGSAWLAANQEADGSWSPAKHGGATVYRPALTALSALVLDRDGKGGCAAQIQRACAALEAMQTADGAFGGEGRAQLYNHAITTYALATLYPGQPALKPTLERALGFIRSRQTVEGGWDYEAGSEGNAALTAWQVRALACAEAQGFESAKIPLRKGLRWLRGTARDDGSIAYHRDSTACSDGLTALAAYALITAGKDFPGLPELGRHVVGSLNASPQASTVADCYRDYAKVLAFDSAGAGRQAEAVRRQMLRSQAAGSRDQWETVGGKLYTTALTLLAAR